MIYLIQSEKLAKLGVSNIWCINLYIYREREKYRKGYFFAFKCRKRLCTYNEFQLKRTVFFPYGYEQ